jgi:hypothetical protein
LRLWDARTRRRSPLGRTIELVGVVLVVLAERVGQRRLRAQRNARGLAPQRTGCRPRSFTLELLPGTCALAAAGLLRDVRELMGKHELAAGYRQIHSSPLEMDVTFARDGPLPGRHLGAVAMQLDVIKPLAERSLHPALQRGRQSHGGTRFVEASTRLRRTSQPIRRAICRAIEHRAPFCGVRSPKLPRAATRAHVGQLREQLLGRAFERGEIRSQALVTFEATGQVATCRCKVLLQRAGRDHRRVVVARRDRALELGARRLAAAHVAPEEPSRLLW